MKACSSIPRFGTLSILTFAGIAFWILFPLAGLRGQSTPPQVPPEVLAYPDLIVYNGKIVTMDDRSRNPVPGTTVQAMAIREGKILKLGNDAGVLQLAGPNTRRIDAKGRTVIPGLIDTHVHLHDMSDHWGTPGISQPIAVSGKTPAELAQNAEAALQKAVQETTPGEWIQMQFPMDPGYDLSVRNKRFARPELDRLAPEHPVHVSISTFGVLNGKAIAAVEDFYRSRLVDEALDRDTGIAYFGTEFNRAIPLIRLHSRPDVIRENVRKEMEEFAAYGVTTFSSHINVPVHVNAYAELERRGEMPIRFAWTHRSGTLFNPDAAGFYTRIGDMAGTGSDHWWNIGVTAGHLDQIYPAIATTIPARPEIKERELSLGEKGDFKRDIMFQMVRSGLRITGTHIAGDRALDNFLDIIEEGSQAAGLTLDQVRDKRHVIDHCALGPRPEQYERIKRLGIIMSCGPKYVASYGPRVLRDYGEKYTDWVAPMKGMIDAGVATVWETDEHPNGTSVFIYLDLAVRRVARDGTVIGQNQKLDRVIALKTATSWASEYVLRENVIGTLERGKWADFLVLNQDYFTVPEEKIRDVRPLITVVGGKNVFLDAGMATELEMSPVGYQPDFAKGGTRNGQ